MKRLGEWIRVSTLRAGLVAAAMACPASARATESPAPLLHEMFQDHAVLQRDQPIRLWGDARADDVVNITLGTIAAKSRADRSGHWETALPAMTAGGPYELSVETSSGLTEHIADVLIGDVYLCSGQSNMELAVANAANAAHEIDAATDDRIRLFKIANATRPSPERHFDALPSWHVLSPASVTDFSAVCYFFARELRKSQHVPLGLVQATWSGSRIEPWISAAGLHELHGFDEGLELLRAYALDPVVGNAKFGAAWERWWRAHAASRSEPWRTSSDAGWQPVPEPMRDWKTWGEPKLEAHDGMVWFRRSVTLDASQAAQPATLSIGAIDEVDETWVNARPIANSFGYATERTYALPRGTLHTGSNDIVINVLSTWDAGGMYGPPDHLTIEFADGTSVPLAGGWHYQYVPDSMGLPPRAPWQSVGGLSSIYDAMIAPMNALTLKGVLWYQGESNVGDAPAYADALQGLMKDWRRQFRSALPFLIVQLPNFGVLPRKPADSSWAQLRAAQRAAVAADGHAALIVTIDLGEPNDLHPRYKQAVGARLALAARHLIYAESMPASGPVAVRARRVATEVEVEFDGLNGALAVYGGAQPTGFELCGAARNSCRYVSATLHATSIRLEDAADTDTRVRFCWSDAPICTLYDGAGLPAGPFELAIDDEPQHH